MDWKSNKDTRKIRSHDFALSGCSMGKQDIAGGTGITAGGDVNFGDVSGQVAIGEFINQFKIEKPSGEALVKLMGHLDQQRLETFNKDILKCYSPSALPEYLPKLREFVTHNRVEEIKDGIEYLQNYRILFISGIGGVGKTTLARGLIETRPANVPLPFWFDFSKNMDATLGDILEKLAGYMNTPDIAKFKDEGRDAVQDDINRLTDELEKESVWLVFDNLETILDGRYFHDTGLDLLFTSLRFSTHKANIIVTSRTLPKLKNGESLIDVVEGETQELKGLKLDFAIDYLKKNGLGEVECEKLEELTIGVDGHPLALMLLVKLVKKYGIKDTLNDLSMFQKSKEDTIKKARKLFEKLAGDEKELLERVSVFRKPESLDAIKSMFTDETSGTAIDKLLDKSLLETDHIGAYWLHPLVREFAYNNLKDKIEVHKHAYEYYLSLPLPEKRTKKEDLQTLIEAHHHACMAEEYDMAADVIFDYELYEDLNRCGSYITIIELCSGVLPKDHFRDEKLLNDISTQGAVLGNLGNAYRDLSQVEKAIKYHKQALAISREIWDRGNEGVWLGNLGLAYSDLGQVDKAIEYYEQAMVIAREIGDRGGEGVRLGNLGNAYDSLGQMDKAIEYHEQAMVIAQEIGDRGGEGAELGNLGSAYDSLGQMDKAIEYLEQAMVIAREIGDRRGKGILLGNLGIAYRALGQVDKAIEYHEKALVIAQEIGDRRGEVAYLGNLGLSYYSLGQVDKAIEYHEKALVISQEIGGRRGEGNQLGDLGFAYYSLGQVDKAIEYYMQALVISREIGDRRNEGNQLGKLGLAYSDLGQVDKAIEYHEQALAISREIGDRGNEGNWLGGLGNAYYSLGQVDKAIEYHEQAMVIAREIGSRQREGAWLGNLGAAYYSLGQVDKAIEYYMQALAISREIGDRRSEGNHLNNLGATFKDENKYREALACYLLAKGLRIEIKDPNIKTTESNLNNLKYELGEKEFEKLLAEVALGAEDIIMKILEGTPK